MPVERRGWVIAFEIGSTGNGRNPIFNGRRQPSCGGTSRMTRECQVRFFEGLGVKLPGPTRQKQRFGVDRRPSGLPSIADIPPRCRKPPQWAKSGREQPQQTLDKNQTNRFDGTRWHDAGEYLNTQHAHEVWMRP